jgi:hypothetical protein
MPADSGGVEQHGGLTPSQRSLRARIAAHALHAQGGTTTTAATAAFLDRFARQVDPTGTLPADERARRAAHARKSYMQSLALKASRARNKKAGRGGSDSRGPAVSEAGTRDARLTTR